MPRHRRLSARQATLFACLALPLLVASGCAVGRNEQTGAIILGIEAGRLTETAGQALGAAAGFLPPPFNYIATGAVSLLGLGGAAKIGSTVAHRARDRADAAFDEGHSRAAGVIKTGGSA